MTQPILGQSHPPAKIKKSPALEQRRDFEDDYPTDCHRLYLLKKLGNL